MTTIALSPQYVTDSDGKRTTVLLPAEQYEALLEDRYDLAVCAERREDERIPLDEVKRQLIEDGLLEG